jgi:DNA-directed RNA polymerase specialized sigma24 family protein
MMQLSLFQEATPSPVVLSVAEADSAMKGRAPAALSGQDLATVSDALSQLAATTDADTHAELTERIAAVLLPYAEAMATLAVPSWPDAAWEAGDVTQELLMEVLAALPWAPVPATPTGVRLFVGWLSTTCLAALSDRLRAAKTLARRLKAVQRPTSGPVLVVESDEEGTLRLYTPGGAAPKDALPSVLARLTSAEAALLQARASGEPWPAIARRLRCSVRTARRRYDHALTAARRAAAAVAKRGTPAPWHPMLAGVAAHRVAA